MLNKFNDFIKNTSTRDLIVFNLPRGWNSKNLRPVLSQPIFVWNYGEFNRTHKGQEINIEEYSKEVQNVGLAKSLPYDDFFVINDIPEIDEETAFIWRVLRRGESIDLYIFLLNIKTKVITECGVFEISDKYVFSYNKKWIASKEFYALAHRSTDIALYGELASIGLQLFLYSLNVYETEVRETKFKVKPSIKHHHNKWQGTVTETIVSVTNKRVRYTGKTKSSEKEMRVEHERRGHYRRYKSGKVVAVRPSVVNKGSPKGRKNTTYKVQ